MKRSKTDMDAGVKYIVIAGGKNLLRKLKKKKCNYAVRYFKDQDT